MKLIKKYPTLKNAKLDGKIFLINTLFADENYAFTDYQGIYKMEDYNELATEPLPENATEEHKYFTWRDGYITLLTRKEARIYIDLIVNAAESENITKYVYDGEAYLDELVDIAINDF